MSYDNVQMPVFGTISSYMIYFQVYPPFIGLSSTDFKKILVMFRLRDNFHVRSDISVVSQFWNSKWLISLKMGLFPVHKTAG